MYTIKFMSGTIKEINNITKNLGMDLWEGIKVSSKKQAEEIVCKTSIIEPWVEIEIINFNKRE